MGKKLSAVIALAAGLAASIGARAEPIVRGASDLVPPPQPRMPRYAKLIEISDLRGIKRPSDRVPTTAELEPRERPGPDQVFAHGIRISTRCRDYWCVDGLSVGDKILLPMEASAAERRIYSRDGFLERVVRVAYLDASFVSVYVAQSELSGGAHANNTFHCRSFELATGRKLTLGDAVPGEPAPKVLARVRRVLARQEGALLDLTTGPDTFSPTAEGWRFSKAKEGAGPDVVVCAEGWYPGLSHAILEIKLAALPAKRGRRPSRHRPVSARSEGILPFTPSRT